MTKLIHKFGFKLTNDILYKSRMVYGGSIVSIAQKGDKTVVDKKNAMWHMCKKLLGYR